MSFCTNNLIIGGGVSGLSTSYHLGHENCLIVEKHQSIFGHAASFSIGDHVFDHGPHVSFTKNKYVRDLLESSVDSEINDLHVQPTNFHQGHWIDHPAQSNLGQVPEPLRTNCYESFKTARSLPPSNINTYGEWMDYAFGKTFTEHFGRPYTNKYWQTDPNEMGIDWIGNRVYFPDHDIVEAGFHNQNRHQTHYITSARYPNYGGFENLFSGLGKVANVRLNTEVLEINSTNCTATLRDTRTSKTYQIEYQKLISTIPLPNLVTLIRGTSDKGIEASRSLNCTELLLVNIDCPHVESIAGSWFYIYDENLLSTRAYFTERLSPNNTPNGRSGLQVEVYAHPNRGFELEHDRIAKMVTEECQKIGLIPTTEIAHSDTFTSTSQRDNDKVFYNHRYCKYANVICDKSRRAALNDVLNELERHGLTREDQDLHPLTNWDEETKLNTNASLILAGRFSQWKYFWTDDCILRGKQIAVQ